MVEVECKSTTLEGPVSDVLLVVVDTSAWRTLVRVKTVSGRGFRTRISPLAVLFLILLAEGIVSPCREDQTKVGRDGLNSGQAEECLGGEHCGGLGW